MLNFFHFVLVIIPLLFISATPDRLVQASRPEIHFGLMDAAVGVNSQTGSPSGWYTSDVSIPIIAPANILANGKPLASSWLSISEEGQHQVEFQSWLAGQASAVTQFVKIDKTPPRVSRLTESNAPISAYSALGAEISNETSGICRIETSCDDSRIWKGQDFPAPLLGEPGSIHQTTWSRQLDSQELPRQAQLVLYHAPDCAGNASPAPILVFRIDQP
jgi:hypothetical protein